MISSDCCFFNVIDSILTGLAPSLVTSVLWGKGIEILFSLNVLLMTSLVYHLA